MFEDLIKLELHQDGPHTKLICSLHSAFEYSDLKAFISKQRPIQNHMQHLKWTVTATGPEPTTN